ncbi:hypothetical protein J1614_004890 [Plenodomus biglobosus]|nr:hypothetical protein J1614_004890 [Plenodomus biglobosus]
MNKSTPSQSLPDLPELMDSHSANVMHAQVSAGSEGERSAVDSAANLKGPHDQPDLWYLSDTEAGSAKASKGKGKAIESAPFLQEPSFEEFNFDFFADTETKPTDSSPGKLTTAPQHFVVEDHKLQTWSVPEAESAANNKQRSLQANSTKSLGVNNPSMRSSPSQPPKKKGRYYSQALSDEDKQALTVGEKNHNLKSWSPQDLINHHESRKELVPRTMTKADKVDALAKIEHDKQSAQRHALKLAKVRRWPRLSSINPANLANINEDTEYPSLRPQSYRQTTRSMIDLRSSSAPAPHLPPIPSHSPPKTTTSSPTSPSNTYTRASSTSEALTRTTTTSLPLPPPSFQPNPNATFDTFLAPHKSGKGETHHENANAKNSEAKPKAKVQSVSPEGSTASSRRKRLSAKTSELFSLRKSSVKTSGREDDVVVAAGEEELAELSGRRFSWEEEEEE